MRGVKEWGEVFQRVIEGAGAGLICKWKWGEGHKPWGTYITGQDVNDSHVWIWNSTAVLLMVQGAISIRFI